jgi:hypothetical protein
LLKRNQEAVSKEQLLVCTPTTRSRGIRKQFLRRNSAKICGVATAKY